MKPFIYLALAFVVTIACKNNQQQEGATKTEVEIEATEGKQPATGAKLPTYRGEFIYLDDAAVLKGRDFIYGVKVDELALELAKQVESVKEEPYDMVPVIVEGVLNPKPQGQDGWEQILTIKRIVTVSNKPAKADIQIEQK